MEKSKWFPAIHGNFGFGCMRLPVKGGQVDYDEFAEGHIPGATSEWYYGPDYELGILIKKCRYPQKFHEHH